MSREPDRIELYIGFSSPEVMDERDKHERAKASMYGDRNPPKLRRHPLSEPVYDWGSFDPIFDAEPPRVRNTSEAAAAIVPSLDLTKHVPAALQRFLAGASARDERALVLCELGREREDGRRSRPNEYAWLALPNRAGWIRGSALPEGSKLEFTEDATSVERDLGMRLQQQAGFSWLGLEWAPYATMLEPPPSPLRAVLTSDVGDVAMATWEGEGQTWIFLPWGVPWKPVLAWLETQGLPHYVPNALVRARRSVREDLLTSGELEVRDRKMAFEEEIVARREQLDREAVEAKKTADELRGRLLEGTGDELVEAVTNVLEGAKFSVENLDQTLGATRSGDLLVTLDGRHWLVEVTSASGSARELEHGKLTAHLGTWPRLRQELLEGGVLVINHDRRQPPAARPLVPYSRPEFLDILEVRVVGTVALCKLWASGDAAAIREAITGPPGQVSS